MDPHRSAGLARIGFFRIFADYEEETRTNYADSICRYGIGKVGWMRPDERYMHLGKGLYR